jgi:hypothetical protein
MDTKALYPSMQDETPPARPAELPPGQLHYAASPELNEKPPEGNQDRPRGLSYPSMESASQEKKQEAPAPETAAAKEVKSPPLPPKEEKPEDKQEGPAAASVPDLDESDRQYIGLIKSDKPEALAEVAVWMEEDIRQLNTLAGVSEEDNRDDLMVVDYLKRKILNADVPAQWRQYWAQQAFAFRLMKKDLQKKQRGA